MALPDNEYQVMRKDLLGWMGDGLKLAVKKMREDSAGSTAILDAAIQVGPGANT